MKTAAVRHFLHCAPWLVLAASAGAQTPAPEAAPHVERRVIIKNDGDQAQAEVMAMAAVDAQQIAADARMAARDAEQAAHDALVLPGDMAFVITDTARSRLVKGAPYCADAVHETVQALADGNRIVHSQSSRLCRDSEGRTRQEVERGGRHLVYLRDPVQKEGWLLDADKKIARKFGSPAAEGAAWERYGEQMREWAVKVREQVRVNVNISNVKEAGAPPVPPVPPGALKAPLPPLPPVPVVLTQSDVTTKDAQGHEHREVRVIRVDDAPGLAPLPGLQAPPAVMARALVFAPRGPGVKSVLDSKEIDGVKVNGERMTWTIDAGKVGNEKPIVITRDVWTSPELMVTVASRDFDPRSGETNYRLQNLKRGEPDAALMKVPADYTQTQTPQPKAMPAPKTDKADKKVERKG
ncbi:MAG TPA: hypothetical protein VGM81_16290 [Burkholderiaceae bacterium]|jgi:hypothetical protein